MKMSSLFGGTDKMQRDLVAAITRRREELKLSHKDLDERCGLNGSSKNGWGLKTTSARLESEKTKMTSRRFSAVSFALDLDIDDVFNRTLSDDEIAQVVQHMKKHKVGLVASCGGAGGGEVDYATQAPVYAILKALSEMDAAAESSD